MILQESVRAFLRRADIRRLKKEVASTGSVEAAELLLLDSTRKGHEKLALHRYALLHRLDSSRCTQFEPYCQAVASRVGAANLWRAFEHVDRMMRQPDSSDLLNSHRVRDEGEPG